MANVENLPDRIRSRRPESGFCSAELHCCCGQYVLHGYAVKQTGEHANAWSLECNYAWREVGLLISGTCTRLDYKKISRKATKWILAWTARLGNLYETASNRNLFGG